MGQRDVFPADVAGGDHGDQLVHGLPLASHHHQPAGVFIKTVHYARTRQKNSLRVIRQQSVEQGTAPVTGCGVHDQPCRFVDHQQIRVFKHDIQRHGFRLECLALRRGPQLNDELIPGFDLGGCFGHGAAVELHHPGLDQLLQIAARELGHNVRQSTVKTACVTPGGHHYPPQLQFGTAVGLVLSVLGRGIGGNSARYNPLALFRISHQEGRLQCFPANYRLFPMHCRLLQPFAHCLL